MGGEPVPAQVIINKSRGGACSDFENGVLYSLSSAVKRTAEQKRDLQENRESGDEQEQPEVGVVRADVALKASFY